MPVYEIPVFQRFTSIGEFSALWGLYQIMIVDGIGLFVFYKNDQEAELTPENVRRHLIGRKETTAIVEADSPEEAIRAFSLEWKGARIGGKAEESKAVWINRKKPILELPACEMLRRNNRGGFVCVIGEPQEDSFDDSAECVLSCYEPPDDFECPVDQFHSAVYELEKDGHLPVETISGYKFVRAKKVMALAITK